MLITFELPLSEKLSLEESLALVAKQGYQRLLLDDQILQLEDVPSRITDHASRITSLTIIQDRLHLTETSRARFVEACEQAYHFGKGKLAIHSLVTGGSDSKLKTRRPQLFSNRRHCAECDIAYREPSPALFSFNHPVGACPTCRGFGRTISIDYDLVLPDRSRTLAQGVVRPWQTGLGAECQDDLLRSCGKFHVPTDIPFNRLAKKWQYFVIEGEPGYGKDEAHEWPRAWYGVKGYFAGWNRKPTRCTCASCSPDTVPTRPARIATANASSRKHCCTDVRLGVQSPKSKVPNKAETRSPKSELG